MRIPFALLCFGLLMAGCRTTPSLKVDLQPSSKSTIEITTNAVLPELDALSRLPSRPFEGEGWSDLFNGHNLKGWQETQFGGRGEVECTNALLVLYTGDPFTGVNFTNSFPTNNYEI